MRRKDREKDADFAFEILRDCEYATLATVNHDGTPYCIPVSPVVINNMIYFHCAPEGKKLDNIKENDNVCISGVRYTRLIPEKFTTEYESAVAAGKCRIINDETEKLMAFHAICDKYAKSNMNSFYLEISKSMYKTFICRINVEQITGKANIIIK